jgi:ClpX C4-type zinc finger/Glyoxalase superfamily protein
MRDFRDAKVMAHALRDALKEKTIETTHSECLELVAKAFGYDNWNILFAKIETADTFPSSPKGVEDAAPTTLRCTFCHKPQHDVRVLISGPSSTYICDECVDVCDDVVGHNDDQVALELFKVDEESENQAYPAVYELLRGKSTEAVLSYVERGRKGAERHRFVLQHVRRRLEMGEGDDPTKEAKLTVLRFAFGKTKEELLVVQQQAERMLQRYEAGLRIAATVLNERGH